MTDEGKKSECDEHFVDIGDIIYWSGHGKRLERALRDRGMEWIPDDDERDEV